MKKQLSNPESPYASAKILGYWTTKNYRDNFKLFASNAIMFNHESPRRGINFVTKKIVRGLCEIKRKKRKILYLGNLNARRDWGYAKEYCEMLWRILQLKKPDDFVLATGRNYSVKDFVELAGKELNFNIIWKGKGIKEVGYDKKSKRVIIKVDPYFFRPNDVQSLKEDSKKLYNFLKWQPKTSFNNLIKLWLKMKYN